MYTLTQIYNKWNLSKAKIKGILETHNVTPVHETKVELSSMVYLKRYSVEAKYYDSETIEDILKNIPYR